MLKRSPLGFRSGRPLPAALIHLGTKREIGTVCKTFVPADLAPRLLGPCSFLLDYYYRVIRELNSNHQTSCISPLSKRFEIDSFLFKERKKKSLTFISRKRDSLRGHSIFEGSLKRVCILFCPGCRGTRIGLAKSGLRDSIHGADVGQGLRASNR